MKLKQIKGTLKRENDGAIVDDEGGFGQFWVRCWLKYTPRGFFLQKIEKTLQSFQKPDNFDFLSS